MQEKLLYVALDHDRLPDNLRLAEKLASVEGRFGYKINMDHYSIGGLPYVRQLLGFRKPVFVDLKINNGSRTMINTLAPLAEAGVEHTNVWAFADRLIKPTTQALKEIQGSRLKVLGVTITSRFDDEYCLRNFGRPLMETVQYFTQVALENGCDGVILPGPCLSAIKNIDTIKLVSGIRPLSLGGDSEQQREIITPQEAIANGADILVCGSPIYKATDPVQALETILSQMKTR